MSMVSLEGQCGSRPVTGHGYPYPVSSCLSVDPCPTAPQTTATVSHPFLGGLCVYTTGQDEAQNGRDSDP